MREKELFDCDKKENNAEKSQKVIFQKSQKLLTKRAPWRQPIQNISITIYSIAVAGYVTSVPAFVRGELPAREASTFCDYFKMTSCEVTAFFLLFDSSKPLLLFLDVLNKD